MMNRVATSSSARTMNADLQNSMRALNSIQQQISSGRRISRVSDGPADAVNSLTQRAELRRTEQFTRTVDRARLWLRAGEDALAQVSDRLTTARSLVVQGRSGAIGAAERSAIAQEIRAIRSSLIGTANATIDGRPVFGGTTASTAAYDANATYQGDSGAVNLPLAPGIAVTVNAGGPAVFGTFNGGDPTAGDVFQLLESLAASVASGDTTATTAGLTLIDAAATRAASAQVSLGTRGGQIEDLDLANLDVAISLKAGISKAEDVDLAEALINLRTREAAYQAALQATAKVIQPSLLDFLR